MSRRLEVHWGGYDRRVGHAVAHAAYQPLIVRTGSCGRKFRKGSATRSVALGLGRHFLISPFTDRLTTFQSAVRGPARATTTRRPGCRDRREPRKSNICSPAAAAALKLSEAARPPGHEAAAHPLH